MKFPAWPPGEVDLPSHSRNERCLPEGDGKCLELFFAGASTVFLPYQSPDTSITYNGLFDVSGCWMA